MQSALALAVKDGGGGNTSGTSSAGLDSTFEQAEEESISSDGFYQIDNDVTAAQSPSQTQRQTGPNVILFLAEDLGYADLGTFGHPYAQTPNIDRLAAEGTKLTNFHSTGKTCSPARAGLMTSRHPATMENYAGDYGFTHLTTVSDLFRDAGYPAVGHVGKWHIGEDLEAETDVYGFTDVRKRSGCESAYWFKDECVVDAALEFIEENYLDGPFYLNVWSHVAHSPIKPKAHLVDRFANVTVNASDFGYNYDDKLKQSKKLDKDLDNSMANYLGALYSMDYNFGRILDALDRLGIADDTILVFTADHGAARIGAEDSSTEQNMLGYCGGLRDYKHSYYEGGVKTPFIIRWPGRVPAGRVNDSPISALDWLPTISTLAQVPYEEGLFEGESFDDVLLGGAPRNRNNSFFWNKEGSGDFAMLSNDGRWKLHLSVDGRWELYDLVNNMEEDVNLIRCKKDVAEEMKEQLKAWTRTLPEKYCRLGKGSDRARFDRLDKGIDGQDGPDEC